ncbi:hypothetical protein [Nocardia terpenica]|nr:hypothetical protein [Nocardia terpenica]
MTVLSSHSRSANTAGAHGAGLRSTRSGVLLMVLAVAFSALGVGCSDRAESVGDAEVEPSGLGKEVTMPIAEATTSLVQPGDEPRSPLRPALLEGGTQQVTLSVDHHVEQQINNQAVRDFSPPAVSIPLTAKTDRANVDLTLGPATSSDPGLAEELLKADGSHAGFEITDRGVITALRMQPKPATPDGAWAALEKAFYQAIYQSIAFPADALGEGAVWTVRQQVSDDVPLDQVTTATLTNRDGNLLTIDLNVTQTPKSKVWKMPSNADALDIVDYVMHGAGTITVDLGMPLPVSGTVTIGGHKSYRDPHSGVLLRQSQRTRVQWGE